MACSQTLSGITRDCTSSLGGIVKVYLANADDISSITITSNEVTAIAMANSATFKTYALRRGAGSLNSTFTIDDANNAKFVTSEIVMNFSRMETTKRVEIMALAQADLVAIVLDANGVYWLVGDVDHPLGISAGDGPTGTAISDANRYGITLQAQTAELPYEILTGNSGVDIDSITA